MSLHSPLGVRDNDASCSLWATQWLLGGSGTIFYPRLHQRARWCPVASEGVSGHVSRGLGTSLAMGESWFCGTEGDLGQHVHDGLLSCCLEGECTPMPTGARHNNRLNDIVSVAQDIPLADVEFCPPINCDPSPNHDTSTSLMVVCDHGWRLVTLPSSTTNPLPPIMKMETLWTLWADPWPFPAELDLTQLTELCLVLG